MNKKEVTEAIEKLRKRAGEGMKENEGHSREERCQYNMFFGGQHFLTELKGILKL